MKSPALAALVLLLTVTSAAIAQDGAAADAPATAEFDFEIRDGTPIPFSAGEQPFLGVFKPESRGELRGGVLLLPDRSTHPDWPQVIGPLRRSLTDHGWSTLAIEMPDLPDEPTNEEIITFLDNSASYIAAGLNHFNQQSVHNIVLLGHGFGALAAADYMGSTQRPDLRGLVVINVINRGNGDRIGAADSMAKVTKPMLDLFAYTGQNWVLRFAEERRETVRKAVSQNVAELKEVASPEVARNFGSDKPGRILYRQMKITGAGHDFIGFENNLTKRIAGWLKRHASGTRVLVPKGE